MSSLRSMSIPAMTIRACMLGAVVGLAGCGDGSPTPAPTGPSSQPPRATPTPVVSSSPPSAAVSDVALLAFLADALDEEPRDLFLEGWWTITRTAPADEGQSPVAGEQRICADSGAKPGFRDIALCTRHEGAEPEEAGVVALWRLAPDESDTGVRAVAHLDNVRSGNAGEPGRVERIGTGPGQHAFAVYSTDAGLDVSERVALYAARGDTFVEVFSTRTLWSNIGECDPGTPGDCVSRLCALRFGEVAAADGFYPLSLVVSEQFGAPDTGRTIAIPRVDGIYRAPAEATGKNACGTPPG